MNARIWQTIKENTLWGCGGGFWVFHRPGETYEAFCTSGMDHFSREFPVELMYPQRFVLRKAHEVYPERLQIIKRW